MFSVVISVAVLVIRLVAISALVLGGPWFMFSVLVLGELWFLFAFQAAHSRPPPHSAAVNGVGVMGRGNCLERTDSSS